MKFAYLLIASLVGSACGRVSPAMPDAEKGGDSGTVDAGVARPCQALPMTCGANANLSCCDSRVVPGGMFFRGYDPVPVLPGEFGYDDMSHPAQVNTFQLDTFEVTVGRFRQFVGAGYGTQAKPPNAGGGARRLNGADNQGGWDPAWNKNLEPDQATLSNSLSCSNYATWTQQPANKENFPILCVTWYEAMAFCIWDGGFLPTEAESMYAMGGGAMQRAYPWSNPAASTTLDCTRANYGGSTWPATACNSSGALRVGSKSPMGDGAWGHADLGGNAFEWGLDWADVSWINPCTDCADLTKDQANSRILRGGSYQSNPSELRGAGSFNGLPPQNRESYAGVRCARRIDPPQT